MNSTVSDVEVVVTVASASDDEDQITVEAQGLDTPFRRSLVRPAILGDRVMIAGRMLSLDDVIAQMARYLTRDQELDFSIEEQMPIGEALFEAIFAPVPDEIRDQLWSRPLLLRIRCADPRHRRLPWALLCSGKSYCFERNWRIVVDQERSDKRRAHVVAPMSPSILVIAPDVTDGQYEATGHEAHIAELRRVFDKAKARVRVVHSFDTFCVAASQESVDYLYYYGHGDLRGTQFELIFADDGGATRFTSPMNIRLELSKMRGDPPVLAYINCCLGGAADISSIPNVLTEVCPAVVTNRITALQSSARAQACRFFDLLLNGHRTPDQAYLDLMHDINKRNEDLGDLVWMTPELHVTYDRWNARIPRATTTAWETPGDDWRNYIDRDDLVGSVKDTLGTVKGDHTRPTAVLVTAGKDEDGLSYLHQRLQQEARDLGEEGSGLAFHAVRPVQPEFPEQGPPLTESEVLDILSRALACNPEEVYYTINTIGGNHGHPSLLMIELPVKHYADTSLLRGFLTWWQGKHGDLLAETGRTLIVVTVECGDGEPIDIVDRFSDALGVPTKPPDGLIQQLFGRWMRNPDPPTVFPQFCFADSTPLGALDFADLAGFVSTFHPTHKRSTELSDDVRSYLSKVTADTGGRYEAILDHLEDFDDKVLIHAQTRRK